MKYYENYLLDNDFDVDYINFTGETDELYNYIEQQYGAKNNLHIIDPVDVLLQKRIDEFSSDYNQRVVYYETPGFILTKNELQEYMDKQHGKNKFFQHSFYLWFRKKLNILMKGNKPIGGSYSFDKFNRKPIPGKDFNKFANIDDVNYHKYKNDYYNEAIDYCETTFKNHYPENYYPDNIRLYAVTHNDIKSHFRDFIDVKLKFFGEYEDAIDFNDVYLYHSVVSPQLNNGLITPNYIMDHVLDKYESNKNMLYDIEGYIRQLVWREYSRLIYLFARSEIIESNYFNNNKLLSEDWYTGNTTIKPIDLAIKTAFSYGYIHHIIRLMIMCNFMNLCGIHPNDAYKWFMEFSLDSYDWVMTNNVYSMGMYSDGGLTTTKPYISSSSYVVKMSNLKKDGDWDKIWTTLYYYFIYKNYDKLKGRGALYLSQWDRQKKKTEMIQVAESFIDEITL
ncbi:putative deoxyribodipyrimidine photolyase-related protein [Cotonvirus japonicus]|uniref:Deoxyribodipyrimidine photolyase-related protein n=1 Tax=Cotonvirus japonicus TaxID=2811091 RepID=A0ABM7NQS3_9VIRU|nr:putative deoxyribodipyrimidine photolyase-related protein [Cotonvirus japonicus]BCS82511.1 putative deoxyribodipyrimidine photolyase-related protein [Cotonvirus japonicus]